MSELDELRDQAAQLAATREEIPDDGGLSLAEWGRIGEADTIVRTVCEEAARRRLRKRLPGAQKYLKDATAALETARKPARTVEASIAKVEADLAEARRRLDQTAVNDDDDLDARTQATIAQVVLAQEIERLTLKHEQVRRVAAPHLEARGLAEARRETARRELAGIEAAIKDPFETASGRRTPEFERYVRYAGAWEDYPDSPASRAVLIGGLKFIGAYDGLVREIVSKWLDGDPETRKQSRILRDDSEMRVEQAPNGQVIAFDVRGRSRVSGETGRTPDPAPDMTQVTAALYGSARTP